MSKRDVLITLLASITIAVSMFFLASASAEDEQICLKYCSERNSDCIKYCYGRGDCISACNKDYNECTRGCTP